MEENVFYCACCLVKSNEAFLWRYDIRSPALRSSIQSPLNLCSICTRRAKQLDLFVQKVQKNQSLLHEVTIEPLVKLSVATLESVDILGTRMVADDNVGQKTNEQQPFNYSNVNSQSKLVNQHIVHKQYEENDMDVPFLVETIYGEDDDEQDNSDEEGAGGESKGKKKVYKRILLSMSDLMKEREEKALEKSYLNAQFQCTPCIVGFMNKISFQKHMEKHDESAGPFKCDICTQRMKSRTRVIKHRKQHQIRYKCKECPLVRNLLKTIKDHYVTKHNSAEARKYQCPDCEKSFWIYKSMKVHRKNTHTNNIVKCQFCDKQVKNYSTLRYHVFTHHPQEVSAPEKQKPKLECSGCGEMFTTRPKLRMHCSKQCNATA